MENNVTEPLGPRPAEDGSRRGLSAARTAILELLDGQPEPTTLAALVLMSGLHENTVRGHLDGLARAGLVTRRRADPVGRGRPAWLWSSTRGDAGGQVSEYASLAVALAGAVRRTSTDPEQHAVEAGREWGRERARTRAAARGAGPTGSLGPAAVRHEVVGLLDDLGFAPETGERAERVRLTRCPLLEAARRDPDVVCRVHLGLVEGGVEEHGASPEGTTLTPFAEPGACVLHLRATRRADGPGR